MTARDPRHAVEATFRIERARLVAGLARLVRDVDFAEELAQDALDGDVGDEMLGLVFTACHPILSPDARAALTPNAPERAFLLARAEAGAAAP